MGKMSPVMAFISAAWDCVPDRAPNRKWASILNEVLKLAIIKGFVFRRNDFEVMDKVVAAGGLNFFAWVQGKRNTLGEKIYASACEQHNRSAEIAFRHWKKRPAYILRFVASKEAYRLFVGANFFWQDYSVTVTSFSKKGDYLIACSWDDEIRHHEKRFKITHKELRAYNRSLAAERRCRLCYQKAKKSFGPEENDKRKAGRCPLRLNVAANICDVTEKALPVLSE